MKVGCQEAIFKEGQQGEKAKKSVINSSYVTINANLKKQELSFSTWQGSQTQFQ